MSDVRRWDAGVELSPGEPPRSEHAIYQGFANDPTPVGIDPQDGLARPAISIAMRDAEAPWMTPEVFVCLADTSEFVRRDEWGEIVQRWPASEVKRAPNGRWYVPRTLRAVAAGMEIEDRVEVEPLRPACQHYVRQSEPHPGDKERRNIVRLCTARMTDEGVFLDLGNSQVFACELRNPRDIGSETSMDEFDAKLVELSTQKIAEERGEATFDVDAALAGQQELPLPPSNGGGA